MAIVAESVTAVRPIRMACRTNRIGLPLLRTIARLAVAAPVVQVGVHGVVGMARRTFRARRGRGPGFASLHIGRVRNGVEVIRIDATTVATQVVQRRAVGNGPLMQFPRSPVGQHTPAAMTTQ